MEISRVLIANRGEIAVRVIRACQELGIETVLAASEADANGLAARIADRVLRIGPPRAAESYLNPRLLVGAAIACEADALHPGYGFLSESPALVEACVEGGIVFVGPSAEHMRQMGNKIAARQLAAAAGVPTLPGSQRIESADEALRMADEIGYPIMIKAAGGGGGRGMKIVSDPALLPATVVSASAEAAAAFGDPTLYMESYLPDARHVEVQVLGDVHGSVVHIGERDCSMQRRHQKVVEEAPAPGLPESLRMSLLQAAIDLARAIDYHGAGTVEFLVDSATQSFYFLEMNTRIQVEHPISEMISGVDLVQEQLRVAAGEHLRFEQGDLVFRGHAIECRINAEVAEEGFRPNAGTLTQWDPPIGPNIRLDTHCYTGYEIPIYYDSMLGKLIVSGLSRNEAVARMQSALSRFVVSGVSTTIPFLRYLIDRPEFKQAALSTQLIDEVLLPDYSAAHAESAAQAR